MLGRPLTHLPGPLEDLQNKLWIPFKNAAIALKIRCDTPKQAMGKTLPPLTASKKLSEIPCGYL